MTHSIEGFPNGPLSERVRISAGLKARIKVAVGEGGGNEDQKGTDPRNRECLPAVSKIETCDVKGCVWISRSE